MAPPAKRRRKNVLSSSSASEDEDVESITKPKPQLVDLISSSPPRPAATRTTSSRYMSQKPAKVPAKAQPRAKTANHPQNAAPIYLPSMRGKAGSKSVSTSPEKPKKKGNIEEKGKSGDIFTFFTKQAQRQQTESGGARETVARTKLPIPNTNATQALDEDVISDDGDFGPSSTQGGSFVGMAARKRARATDSFAVGDGELPSASQRFMKPSKPVPEVKVEDTRPWAERFAPNTLDELAVHKRKVADVRTWLESVMNGRLRHQRLLVLKGGAGTGKTITIQLLAKAMDCDVLEWHNPVGSVASSDGYLSMAAQFEEFMGRGGKFGQLDIFSSDPTVLSKPEPKPLDRRKNIILIEEFPNTFTRSSTALQSFRSAILQYLTANTPQRSMFNTHSDEPVTPVVLIISETLLTTMSASADSFTAHRLLGPEILQHPGVGVIEFNAIAPTILAKALETVVQKESRKSGRKKTPGPMVLKKLGEIGDIRSAVAALEFLCLRGDTDGDWGAKVAFGKGKKTGKDVALTKMEEESLELVTRREASLGIFHAVGKVVHNKRDEVLPTASNADVEKLPDFMSLHSRPHRSQVVVNELIDETGTDTQTFIAALHENYLLSCDAPPESYDFTTIDHAIGCIDALSDSDLLCPSWDGSINPTGFGGGIGGRGSGGDVLRQDVITFHIAVRGLLFSLPYPVKRKSPATGGSRSGKGSDAFKMFYPTSLKLWRMREEIESAIDLWVSRLLKGEEYRNITTGAAMFARPKPGSVESWKSATTAPSRPDSKGGKQKQELATPLLSVGASARKEMLLERLPYMLLIAKARKTPSSIVSIKEMEKVATFHGIGGPSEESNDEGDGDDTTGLAEEWATDKPAEGTTPQKKGLVFRGRGAGNSLPLQQLEQKLVLSDDDIEDD